MTKPNMSLKKNPMPSQEPQVRAHNFNEVATGYTEETALDEALRCLSCKNMPCVSGEHPYSGIYRKDQGRRF